MSSSPFLSRVPELVQLMLPVLVLVLPMLLPALAQQMLLLVPPVLPMLLLVLPVLPMLPLAPPALVQQMLPQGLEAIPKHP
jgi:hypothetical protein